MNTKINLSGSYRGVSGARYYLILDPEDRSVSDYAAVGSAVPAAIWHKRQIALPLCPDVVVGELRKELENEGTQAIIASILDLYLGEHWDGSNRVGQWPTDQWGAPTDELEGQVYQLGQLLKQVPSHIEASDILEWGDIDWSMFHGCSGWEELISEVFTELVEQGYWVRREDLSEHLAAWLREAVSDLEDDDRSSQEQKDLTLGRRLLAGVA